jgi:hypothetical protein
MSEFFCTAPWDHLHLRADKFLGVCCTSSYRDDSCTFEEFWNSDFMKSLRVSMMKGEPPHEICKRCLGERVTEVPQYVRRNQRSKDSIEEIVKKTSLDGTTTYLPKTIELRTNLCNFKCRICDDEFSTSIRGEKIKAGLNVSDVGSIDSISDLKLPREIYSRLTHISWAGGEPFMSPMHWEVMNELKRIKHFNPRINYYTNFSFSGDTLEKAIELLKPFTKVTLFPSLDGTHDDVEYIRSGLCYQRFIEVTDSFKKNVPSIRIMVGYTATSVGLLSLCEVIRLCIEKSIDFEGRKGVFDSKNHFLSINALKPEVFSDILEHAKYTAKGTYLEDNINSYTEFLKNSYKNPIIPNLDTMNQLEKLRGMEGYYKIRMTGKINE